ncbi:period circadian protein-like isoform X1 [Sitophilus oryzae]|uniref:Period circadian protein n=1 Tax=Sitophilus oryzae TaxID=7048 RepID=A0A6J2YYL5_SITOR|nr:period circadian protein-like isoform X1 [Sitophilus oryzae]XP_030767930.1 period circadian protein-like isoform X1 [Sitophilus oryzae]
MESESGTSNTKISESGYSNSCSNTTSQHSTSTKSRHSGSNSSRSSGYCGAPTGEESSENVPCKRSKEHKKKKTKTPPEKFSAPAEMTVVENPTDDNITGVECPAPTTEASEPVCTAVVAALPAFAIETSSNELENIQESTICMEEDSIVEKADDECDKENLIPCNNNEPQTLSHFNEGFCCVISIHDGAVIYTTPSLTNVLGFPKDTWTGRSFVDFIHPKDRDTFASQITNCLASPLMDAEGKLRDFKNNLYVCLRQYKGLKSPEFGIVNKQVSYQAFHLTVTIKRIEETQDLKFCNNNHGIFLVVIAVPVHSSYKVPGEKIVSVKFGIRHTASSIFNHVDSEVVSHFGFLPQDMLGKSVFDFYHPEDMPILKELYKSVITTCHKKGSVFRCHPHRFLVQNGCFAMIETEWSRVMNPWSKKMEFVIRLQRVLQGPLNPNVFDTPSDEEFKKIPEEIIKQGKEIQIEILKILSEEIPKPTDIAQQEVTKRYKVLADFMETLTNDVNPSKLEIELPQDLDPTISERDSVMLGEISPHHDYCDSKSSSETPPSYNQLNYNENINRFFQSNPKTTISDESNSQTNTMDTDSKNITDCVGTTQKCLSPVENSGASRTGSAGNLSSGSNPNLESGTTSGTNTSNNSYKPPQLTESVLVKHNEDMEKILIQRHREERFHNKDAKKCHQKLEKHANETLRGDENQQTHGVKRSGSHSWEGDCHKMTKHHANNNNTQEYCRRNQMHHYTATHQSTNQQDLRRTTQPLQTEMHEVNAWPPFSLTNQSTNAGLNGTMAMNTGIFPVYYLPASVQQRSYVEPLPRYQVQYLPANVFYNTMFPTPPVLCPTVPVFSIPVTAAPTARPANATPPRIHPEVQPATDMTRFDMSSNTQTPVCHRPSSQATSVKAEPGSRMGSIASASVANKAMSECSRKDMGLLSVCSPGTPVVSPPDGETQAGQYKSESKMQEIPKPKLGISYRKNNNLDEESSCYSSSYSSFLKTDTGSGSNDDTTSQNRTSRTDDFSLKDILRQHQKSYPMRKKEPPWLESVSMSPELIYRYQVSVKDLEDILKNDLNVLKNVNQPMMVNDQLHQLYIEMELEGLSKALTLEEGFMSSSSSGDDTSANGAEGTKKRRSYSSLMMIYEENAPLPPPEANC